MVTERLMKNICWKQARAVLPDVRRRPSDTGRISFSGRLRDIHHGCPADEMDEKDVRGRFSGLGVYNTTQCPTPRDLPCPIWCPGRRRLARHSSQSATLVGHAEPTTLCSVRAFVLLVIRRADALYGVGSGGAPRTAPAQRPKSEQGACCARMDRRASTEADMLDAKRSPASRPQLSLGDA